MSRRQRSRTEGTGSTPQWGASVTLRALQSPTVPITPTTTSHRHIIVQKQPSQAGSAPGQLSSSRSNTSSERRPSNASSGASPLTVPVGNTPSGSSGRNSSNISDVSSTSGSAANATVAKAHLVKSMSTPRKMSLSQLAYQQHSPAPRQSALGVYEGSPSVSPTMPVFPHGVSVAPPAPALGLDTQSSPKRGSTGSTSPALLRGMALPTMYDPSQQSPTKSSQDFDRRTTLTNTRTEADMLVTPRPSMIPAEGDDGSKNVAHQTSSMDAARRPAPQSPPQPPISLRALRQKSSTSLSISASPGDSGAPSSVSSRSNTNSIGRDSTSSGRPAFFEEYNLDWDPDNSGYGNGGWDAETDDEAEKRQAQKRNKSRKNVTMSDKVSFSRPPRSPTSPKASLFRKAFRSANPKRDRSSSSASARRSSVKPNAPVPSPRSILRQRGATVGATSSPGRMSPFTSPSRLDPAAYLASRSPARETATVPNQGDEGEEIVFDISPNQRRNPLPTPPKQSAPKRRPSVPDSVCSSVYAMTPQLVGTDLPFGSPLSHSTPQMVDDQGLSPSSSMLSTPYFPNDLALSGSGGNAFSGSPVGKNGAALHPVAVVRRGSDAESAASQYDQDGSWDGHSSVRDSAMSVVTPVAAAAALNIALKNKRGVNLAEKSPLLAQKIVEMDESISSNRHAVDGGDNEDATKDDSFADFEVAHEQRRESEQLDAAIPAPMPTRIRIVRTEGDRATGYDETLDSIHVFPTEPAAKLSSSSSSKSTPIKTMFSSLLSPPKTQVDAAKERADAAAQDAEYENVEVNRFMSDHAARVKRIRSSGLFELDGIVEHTWPTSKEWRDKQTGKLNAPGLVVAGALSCLAYLSPVHFRDMQRAPIPDKRGTLSRPVSEFTMDSLKTSGERLFMSAFPMYERAFATLRRLWRWDSKIKSTFWCTCYFAAWWFSCLLPSAVALVVLNVARNRRGIHARRQHIAAQAHRALVVNQLHIDDWQKTVKQAECGDGLVNEDAEAATAASEALRRYGHAAAMLAARLADAHERLSNTAVWARTPATMRTLIVLILIAFSSFAVTPAMLVSMPGLVFGVAFWFLAPLLERKSRFVSWLTLDPVEFMLAGVPNDAQNAVIILRRNQEAGLETPTLTKQVTPYETPVEEREIVLDSSANVVRSTSAATATTTTATATTTGAAQGFIHDARWRSNVISFAASYQGLKGMLTLTTERLSFRAAAATSKGPSLDISLERIAGMNKISSEGGNANDGLQLNVRVSNNTVRKYALLEMNMRDQAFNRILALAPHQWTQERPVVTQQQSTLSK